MKRGLVWGLVLLAAGAVVWWRLRPLPPVEGEAAALAAPAGPAPDSPEALLAPLHTADGTLNPFACRPMPDSVETATVQQAWRARYAPLRTARAATSATAPLIVGPVYDATTSGTGPVARLWGPLLRACLAADTQAPVWGVLPPEQIDTPEANAPPRPWDELAPAWKAAARAAAGPGAPAESSLLTGVLETTSGGQQRLRLLLVPGAGGPAREVFAASAPPPADALAAYAAQRQACAAAVAQLSAAGLAPPRAAAPAAGLDLDAELSATLRMLNTPDTWAVMEGIDRALQLAELFPASPLPLQAGAYGCWVLKQLGLGYGTITPEGYETLQANEQYAERAWVLAQLALLRAPQAVGPQILLTFAMGDPPERRLAVLARHADAERWGREPVLRAWFRLVMDGYPAALAGSLGRRTPLWLRCIEGIVGVRREAGSPHTQRIAEFAPRWAEADLALLPHLWQANGNLLDNSDPFRLHAGATRDAYRLGIANELLAVFAAAPPTTASAQLAARLGAQEATLREQAAQGPAASFRQQVLPQVQGAPTEWLALLDAAGAPLLAAGPRQALASGWPGLACTPAERLLLARRRTEWAPVFEASFDSRVYGSFNSLWAGAGPFLAVRPEALSARMCLVEFHWLFAPRYPGARAWHAREVAEQARRWPLPLDLYIQHVRTNLLGDAAATRAALAVAERNYREQPWLAYQIGKLEYDQGEMARAAVWLDRARRDLPRRYDVANLYAWARCQMGDWRAAELREIFTAGPQHAGGDPTLFEDALIYLLDWVNDPAAARELAARYPDCGRTRWLVRVAQATGETSAALKMLQKLPPPAGHPLARAEEYVERARAYWTLNQPAPAAECVQQAARLDSWKASVILAMADQALRTSHTAEARQHLNRMLKRYGREWEALEGLARCLEAEHRTSEALAVLTPAGAEDTLLNSPAALLRRLALHVQLGQTEAARRLAVQLLHHPRRRRGHLRVAAQTLGDAALTRLVQDRTNALMAHTHTPAELAALYAAYALPWPAE